MKSPNQLYINLSFLKNRVTELGYKQWWLAEQVGVDRKTVSRWLSGVVRSIQIENMERLAEALSCKIEDLILPNELDQLATEADQRTAAQIVTTSSLIERLGPIGEWNVIESLLKATVVSDLPLCVLGELYNQLCVASWRQSKIDQAAAYNKKAKEIALKLNDKTLLAQALLSEANIFSWRGFSARSIETYKEVLELELFISPKALGATYSNLGAVLYEIGHLDEGRKLIQKSIDLFLIDGTAMNLSIAHGHLAIIDLKSNHIDSAQDHAKKSIELAKAFDYLRGIYMGMLFLSEVDARRGLRENAEKQLKESFDGFESQKIDEGLNYEFAGRICRVLGQNLRSLDFLKKGVAVSNDFPLYQASVYRELALTERAMGLNPKGSFSMASRLFDRCEAPLKVSEIEILLNSKG
jgi:tetratricopeptide (TPR) repeat protein